MKSIKDAIDKAIDRGSKNIVLAPKQMRTFLKSLGISGAPGFISYRGAKINARRK